MLSEPKVHTTQMLIDISMLLIVGGFGIFATIMAYGKWREKWRKRRKDGK